MNQPNYNTYNGRWITNYRQKVVLKNKSMRKTHNVTDWIVLNLSLSVPNPLWQLWIQNYRLDMFCT